MLPIRYDYVATAAAAPPPGALILNTAATTTGQSMTTTYLPVTPAAVPGCAAQPMPVWFQFEFGSATGRDDDPPPAGVLAPLKR